jgi:hypothetical protein
MSKKQESLRAELQKVLSRGGRAVINKGSDGKAVPVPEEAEVFEFEFTKEGETYGKVFVSIDGLHQLIVYFDDAVSGSPKNGSTDSESWEQLIKTLKRFAMMKQLSFKLANIDNLENDMAKREHIKRQEKMYEGYHAQGKKASYSDNVPTTKIIIKHKREMQEGEQRFRQIDKIFIENSIGERMLAPTDRPGLARVFARHIAEGGKANDDRWNHISGLCEEYQQMAGFVRATRNGQFNESAQKLVSEGINHYQKLRESLGKMSGKRGYNSYFESYTPALMEDEEQVDLSEMFMSSSLDPRIESVMPILRKLSKNITETSDMAETIALEEWASEIIGEAPELSKVKPSRQDVAKKMHGILSKSVDKSNMARVKTQQAVGSRVADIGAGGKEYNVKTDAAWDAKDKGLSEDSFDSPVASAITRRILMQRSDLLAKYGPEKVTAAIDDVADFVGDTDEIGSSDVSGWVKQVEQSLTGMSEGWKGELAGGTAGGIAGSMAGNAIVPGIGGIVGGAIGGTAGGMAGRALGDIVDEEQLNEIAPLLAIGARAIIPLLSKVGPALGRMASTAGKAGSEVAGKAATGIGRGTADVAKSAAQSAAQNAGTIGVGVGAYQAITDVANSLVGGVGEVYHDAKSAAGAIAQVVGNSVDKATIAELAMAAAKYAIPIGILLAVLYGGKKLIDQIMAEGADDSVAGLAGKVVGGAIPNPSDFVAGFKKTFEGQEDLDAIKRLLGK